MSKIRFIYFDIGEVLIKGAHTKDVATFLGIPYEVLLPVFKKYQQDALIGKITSEEFLQLLRKELLLNPKLTNYPELWIESVKPIYEMHELMNEVNKTHQVGFFTNLFTHLFDTLRNFNYIPNLQDAIVVGSWQVGLTKPDKKMYVLAQEKAGVKPEEILFIDDNKENVEMARKLGWQAIVFDPENPGESIRRIKKLL